MTGRFNRRDFLRTSTLAAGAVAVGFGAAPAPGPVIGANDRISLGFIGTGRMGRGNLRHALATQETRVVALCDVYRPNTARASSLLPHLGNIAYRTGARLEWDARTERCRENAAANELVGREYRTPWKI